MAPLCQPQNAQTRKVHLRRSEYQSSCLLSICIMAILKIYIQKVNFRIHID